ncbi:MAG: VCBS repeat-containing protein, partial [Caldilineaceae bacterium]|nr:VCBS repeat-containing protein [Caldilineaceae bacterium]
IDVADIDGDGDQDILVASRFDDKISIYVNNTIHRSAIINGERIVATYKETRSVAAADLDNDGDMDLLSTSSHIVAWHENDGDRPPRFASHTIVDNLLAGRWVDTGDLDGDGDIDVLAADRDANTIWWFENRFNQSGAVTFTPHLVVNDALGVRDVHAADIDGDGDMDVYSASDTDNTIAWYENLDGRGTSFARHNVTQTAMYARSSYAADIDGDGRLDLMSASARDDRVAWYRNTGGGVWPEYTIINTADGAQFIYAADIDSDGDADLLAVSERDNTIAWLANRLRAGRGFDHYIVSNQAAGVHAAIASDMDGDGDLDIVAAVEYSDEIIWYESSGGYTPSFTAHVISAFADVAHGVFAADLDNDGDLDVLSASRADGKIAWYENRGGQYGIREARPQVSAGGQQLMVDMILSSRGRPGDPALELRALTLRFQTKDGRRLTGAQAAELFARIAIYRDNGDGAFNPAQDALAASETTFPLNNGEMTVSLPNLPTQAAASDRYFVAVEPKNSICAAENIRISVITNRRTAADITTGFPLLAEYMRDLDASGDPNFARKPALIINELMPDNVSTLEDPQEPGEYPDWFELYNTNDLYIDLGGMYLSDDPNNLRTHRIPDGVIIPPFGYLVFIADGEPEQGPLHTSFRLSKGGEPLVLFDIDERGNQVIDVVDFDSVPADVAFGRSPADAKVWIELKTPTPGRFNLDEPPTDFVFLPAIIYPGTCN